MVSPSNSLLSVFAISCLTIVTAISAIEKSMIENQIVPDVIDECPKDSITIKYPSGVSVNQGNELTPTQVKGKPTLTWNANQNDFYTLIFSDPDAPSRSQPTFREVRHWMVGNIPGNKVNEGETIVEFIGSGPPKDTGLHRYVTLVFKQPNGKIEFNEPHVTNRSRDHRLKTSTRDIAKKYGLGNPVAGNFYQAQYDDYVPILHAQLSSN